MKTLIVISMALILSFTVGCQKTNEQSKAQNEVNLQEVKNLVQEFSNKVLDGDSTAFYKFMQEKYLADNAELITPEGSVIDSNDLLPWYRQYFGPGFSHFKISGGFTDTKYTISGNLVVQKYIYKLQLTPQNEGEAMTESGIGIHVFQKDTNGKWKMIYDIWVTPKEVNEQ